LVLNFHRRSRLSSSAGGLTHKIRQQSTARAMFDFG
jgi:hypothetical protein